MNVKLIGLGVAVLGACAGTAAYVNRRIDQATTDVRVDADAGDERDLRFDPEMLRRVRALDCGVEIDAQTGLVTPDEELTWGVVRMVNVPSTDAEHVEAMIDASTPGAEEMREMLGMPGMPPGLREIVGLLNAVGAQVIGVERVPVNGADTSADVVHVDGRPIGPDGHPLDEPADAEDADEADRRATYDALIGQTEDTELTEPVDDQVRE